MTSSLDRSSSRRTTPLTVAECLAMPHLREATVASGAAGLDRVVRWVHVVDVPNIEECLVGGELVMTSGISLGHDQSLQRRIVPVMAEMGLAGLVVALGPYVQEIPERILAAAADYGIPVLALPWDVNFRDVTETIQTAIIDRQRAMLEQSLEVHGALTNLVLEGGGLPALTARLTHLLGRSTAVLDPLFHPLAGVGVTAGSLVRLRTLSQQGWRENAGALELDAGEVRGVLVPVVVERQLHGYLWVDGAGGPLAAHELLAAEHGATVAALMLYKDEAVRQAERRQERDTFDRLLEGEQLDPETTARAERLLPVARPLAVLVMDHPGSDLLVSERMVEEAARRLEPAALVRSRAGELVLITSVTEPGRLDDLAARLRATLTDDHRRRPIIGIGEFAHHPGQIAQSYRSARDALRIGRHADPEAAVHHAAHMVLLRRALQALGGPGGPGGASAIVRLAEHDRDHAGGLVDTLDVYLRYDGNATAAARALGIHRHTLLYRLQRIAEIGGVERTPSTRLELRLGLLLHRLGNQQPRAGAGPALR